MFSLVVDDFGVKCQGIQRAKHLKEALEKYYEVAVEWKGRQFCGITLDCNYNMRHVDLSVLVYVHRKRTKYQHSNPKNPQHSPYQEQPIQYGTKVQQFVKSDTSAPISDKQIKCVQDIVGTFVWHICVCDTTLAASISALASCQTKVTKDFMAVFHQLLDYLATHPDAAIWYHASDMILAFDTDASYLSKLCGKSRAAAYYYITNKDKNNSTM